MANGSKMTSAASTSNPPLIRTDFTSDAAWQEIVDAVTKPTKDGFVASLSIVDDSDLSGVSAEHIAAEVSEASDHAVLFLVDQMTIRHVDHPVLCIDLPVSGRSLRVTPAALCSVENNLALANMDFDEFSDAADVDGIFRGF
jgi:hypothetical protein